MIFGLLKKYQFEFKADYVAKCLPNLLPKLFSDLRGNSSQTKYVSMKKICHTKLRVKYTLYLSKDL